MLKPPQYCSSIINILIFKVSEKNEKLVKEKKNISKRQSYIVKKYTIRVIYRGQCRKEKSKKKLLKKLFYLS